MMSFATKTEEEFLDTLVKVEEEFLENHRGIFKLKGKEFWNHEYVKSHPEIFKIWYKDWITWVFLIYLIGIPVSFKIAVSINDNFIDGIIFFGWSLFFPILYLCGVSFYWSHQDNKKKIL